MQGLFGTTPKSQPVPSAGLSTSYFFYKDAFQPTPMHNQLQDEDKCESLDGNQGLRRRNGGSTDESRDLQTKRIRKVCAFTATSFIAFSDIIVDKNLVESSSDSNNHTFVTNL
ncbi:hypothetical protein [Paenibacillus chitinolyticus]|uniref:hypothetical protein n=1 Tax=Paenibacillus chitinolyticus TaxID=79263 RepID=UPI003631B590